MRPVVGVLERDELAAGRRPARRCGPGRCRRSPAAGSAGPARRGPAPASTGSYSGGEASSTTMISRSVQDWARIDRTAVSSPSSGRNAVTTTEIRWTGLSTWLHRSGGEPVERRPAPSRRPRSAAAPAAAPEPVPATARSGAAPVRRTGWPGRSPGPPGPARVICRYAASSSGPGPAPARRNVSWACRPGGPATAPARPSAARIRSYRARPSARSLGQDVLQRDGLREPGQHTGLTAAAGGSHGCHRSRAAVEQLVEGAGVPRRRGPAAAGRPPSGCASRCSAGRPRGPADRAEVFVEELVRRDVGPAASSGMLRDAPWPWP